MRKERTHYTADEKVAILRRHLLDKVPVSAIRDLAARFADAATRAHYETIRSLFTPDAVFTIGEPFAVTCKGITGDR
jgi:hypothetical protein